MEWLDDILDNFEKKNREKEEHKKILLEETLKKGKETRHFNERIIREIIIPKLRESSSSLQKRNIKCELKENEIEYADDKGMFIKDVCLTIKPDALNLQPPYIKVIPISHKNELKIEYKANSRVGLKYNSISSETLSTEIFEKMLKQIFSEMFPA